MSIRLTRGEEAELRTLATKGPQHTYGKGRAAIQNRLIAKGMAYMAVTDDMCAITKAGEKAFYDLAKP